jgi:hypothetical protein
MAELPEKSDTTKVLQSIAAVNRMAHVSVPEPALQLVIDLKSTTDMPVKLPP